MMNTVLNTNGLDLPVQLILLTTSEYVWNHGTIPQWDQIKISDKTFQDFLSLQKLKLRNVPFLWFNSFTRHFDLFLDNTCHVKITIDFVSPKFILHLHRKVSDFNACKRFSLVVNQKNIKTYLTPFLLALHFLNFNQQFY